MTAPRARVVRGPRLALAATATALLPLAALVPAAAQAAAPAVTAPSAKAPTLAPLPSSSAAGKKLTVHGKAAPRAQVAVQRRYAGGSWTTVTTVHASRSGAWSARLPLVQGGTTSVRARSGGRSSTARSLAVYAWLPIDTQSTYVGGSETDHQHVPISGHTYSDSYEAVTTDSFGVAVEADGRCTVAEAWDGVPDNEATADGNATVTVSVQGFSNGMTADGPAQTATADAGQVGHARLTKVTSKYISFFVSATSDTTNSGAPAPHPVLATPRVYCNAAQLPTFDPTGS